MKMSEYHKATHEIAQALAAYLTAGLDAGNPFSEFLRSEEYTKFNGDQAEEVAIALDDLFDVELLDPHENCWRS